MECLELEKSMEEMCVSEDDDDVECPVCHLRGLSCHWICCDKCNIWYHTYCTDVEPDNIPDICSLGNNELS